MIDYEKLKDFKEHLWKPLDESPKFPKSDDELLCSILVLYDNGNMFLYRYGKNGIPNDVTIPNFRSIERAQWCYCNDLIP